MENKTDDGASRLNGGLGVCCYGGRKPKIACASCAAWKAEPYRPLKDKTDDDVLMLAKIAFDDTAIAAREQPNSDWHSECFAALYICAEEMNRRGLKMQHTPNVK